MSALWFILIVAVLLVLQAKLYKENIFKNLMIERKFEKNTVFPGDTTVLKLIVYNKKFFPVTYLKLQQKLPVELEMKRSQLVEKHDKVKYLHYTVYSLFPFQKITRKFELVASKRGIYNLFDGIRAFSTDLFGSQEYEKEFMAPARLVVYPRLIDLKNFKVIANSVYGDLFVKRWIIEDPVIISGIRDYTNSDSFKSINWKATAKTQKLKVNKYDYTADKKILILFNVDFHRYILRTDEVEKFEKAIEVAATLSVNLIQEGIPVGLSTNAICLVDGDYTYIEPSAGEGQISRLLEIFAGMSFLKKYSKEDIISYISKVLPWGTDLLIVTPFVDEELLALAGKFFSDREVMILCMDLKGIEKVFSNVKVFYYNEEGKEIEVVG
ncbi:DUF58 domain-containing protein [Caldanaerobacter sp.]|uniref:DUF58 domain-containing protein n=1 Tax=Caldanaerobacter sp. TaxID=2930036 RepID=UPI003C708855